MSRFDYPLGINPDVTGRHARVPSNATSLAYPAESMQPTRSTRTASGVRNYPDMGGGGNAYSAPDMSYVHSDEGPNNSSFISSATNHLNTQRQSMDANVAAANQAYNRADVAANAPPVRAIAPSGTASATLADGTTVTQHFNHSNDAPRTDIDQVQKDRQVYANSERQLGDTKMAKAGGDPNYSADRKIVGAIANNAEPMAEAQVQATQNAANYSPEQVKDLQTQLKFHQTEQDRLGTLLQRYQGQDASKATADANREAAGERAATHEAGLDKRATATQTQQKGEADQRSQQAQHSLFANLYSHLSSLPSNFQKTPTEIAEQVKAAMGAADGGTPIPNAPANPAGANGSPIPNAAPTPADQPQQPQLVAPTRPPKVTDVYPGGTLSGDGTMMLKGQKYRWASNGSQHGWAPMQ